MVYLAHPILLFSAAAATSLFCAVWEGAVLVAGVWLCLRFMTGVTASTRSVLWTAVLVLIVLLPFVSMRRGSEIVASATHVSNIAPLHLDVRWSILLVSLWAVMSLVRAIQLVRSGLYLRRIASAAIPIKSAIADRIELRVGGRSVELCESADVDRPSVVGFFSPRILVPPALLKSLSEADLTQVVMHEMQHLRRADDWTNLLQKVSLVLFPINPVLFWVERRLCMERELACDDHVLQCTGKRKAYATCLTNLAEHSILRRGVTLTLGAWERQSELAQRVHRILRRPEQPMGRRQSRVVLSVLVLGLLGGAVTLERGPQFVSFAPSPDYMRPGQQANVILPSSGSGEFAASMQRQAAFSGQGASATLVKAFMPPSASSLPGKVRPTRRNVPARKSVVHREAEPASWVVMTEWHEVQPPSRTVPVMWKDTQPSYAAVPFGNGWLIIQL